MIAILFALVLATDGGKTESVARVEPVDCTYERMARDIFDPAWILPDGLPLDGDDDGRPAFDLTLRIKELATRVAPANAADPRCPRGLGDLALALCSAKSDDKARAAVLERLQRADPRLFAELEDLARELTCDSRLVSKRWDPDDDDRCDGIYFARPLTLEKTAVAPWKELDGSKLVQQACVLIAADLETIKATENDYSTYRARPGASYEAIYPVRDSFLRGRDAAGQEFAALKLYFRCDLPFPFSSYQCDLRILNRVSVAGDVVCDIYSKSRDFYWLAGRDTFVPLHASDGTWVGTIVVRLFGFDLKGVPDGDDARRAGLRSSLGCLKRDSEKSFRAAGSKLRTSAGRFPTFEVLGGS